jgi:hypothetical protein
MDLIKDEVNVDDDELNRDIELNNVTVHDL